MIEQTVPSGCKPQHPTGFTRILDGIASQQNRRADACFGSFSSDQPAPDALGMSASLRSRPKLRTAAIRRGGRVGPGNFTPSLSQIRT